MGLFEELLRNHLFLKKNLIFKFEKTIIEWLFLWGKAGLKGNNRMQSEFFITSKLFVKHNSKWFVDYES